MGREKNPKITPVYLKSANHTWVPALQLKVHNGKATVGVPKFNNGESDMMTCAKASKTFPYHDNQIVDLKDYPNGILPMQNVDSNGNLEEYKDMVDLPFMHEVRIETASLIRKSKMTLTWFLYNFIYRRRFYSISNCVTSEKSRIRALGIL
jgi:hypothetical protein